MATVYTFTTNEPAYIAVRAVLGVSNIDLPIYVVAASALLPLAIGVGAWLQ